MIDNYEIDKFGVIHQIERKPFDYSEKYIQKDYCSATMDKLTQQMAHLRMGYLLGTLGFTPHTILDVGFGNGAFLEVAQKVCTHAFGYDVFDNEHLPEFCIRVNTLTGRHYDVITFFDSLEHCPDLDFVGDLKCDYVMISLPWCLNFRDEWPLEDEWFKNWKHRKPDEHLHHFGIESLTEFMASHNFELVTFSHIEDIIRTSGTGYPNILTAIYKKK